MIGAGHLLKSPFRAVLFWAVYTAANNGSAQVTFERPVTLFLCVHRLAFIVDKLK